MKKRYGIWICIMMLLVCCACGNGTSTESTETQTGTAMPEETAASQPEQTPVIYEPDSYDTQDQALLMKIGEEEKSITLYHMDTGNTYTLEVVGTSTISDKYGEPLSLKQLKPGDLVEVTFLKDIKRLNSLKLASDGWSIQGAERYTLDWERQQATINKDNYSHHVIKQTGIMNINCLSEDAPFAVFEKFGFKSGRNTDKFADYEPLRSDNGLVFLPRYINSFMSLKVEQYVDLDTHGMFICSVTESRVIGQKETMTYTYYQSNVKPKPQTDKKKGYVCKICGWVYEGETLPDDIICPLCKHGAADFEPLN